MTPERWQRVKELFEAALERQPAERPEFLREACGEDEALRAELESLLAEERVVGTFLSNAATKTMQASSWNIGAPAARTLPSTIGHYRIVGFVGKGGMAVVYKAEQQEPRRIVALKVIKPGLVGPEYERRFEREKDALARLQHEGIARIYEAGTADSGSGPQPYFAMELIEQGQPLTEYAESKRLTTRQRLELMAQVCDAVHHAHQHFIIHRDLKPSNILVDERGHPKVLDFGVARITDSDIGATRQTDIGQLVGTLEYMSPEQARGDPSQVDTRSDIYALGVILYELLAAKLPYDLRDKSPLETLATILGQDPAKLSSVNRQYRGDIETIAAKCLEKDKAGRYSSAAELAADIRRYLNNEPITARPASASYRFQKFARRNKAIVGGAAAVFAVLVAGIMATSWQVRVAIRERNRARDAETTAEAQQKRAEEALKGEATQRERAVEQTQLATENATQAEARELLARANGSLNDDPERSLILGLYSWDKARAMVGGLEQLLHEGLLQSRVRLTIRGHQGGVKIVAWSPDGRKLATAGLLDQTASVWEAGTGRQLMTLPGYAIAWSPDGMRLAIGNRDQTAEVLDAETGRELLELHGDETSVYSRLPVTSVAWSPDGSKLATAAQDQTVRIWDARTGRELLALHGHRTPILTVAWSPDGGRLASASSEGARMWEVTTGHELLALPGQQQWGIRCIVWSPDGTKLAGASANNTAKVWQAATGRELLTLRGHEGSVNSVAWSPDGSSLATASDDSAAKVWEAGTGRELLTLRGHQGFVNGTAWSPDGASLATASRDGTIRTWTARAGRELLTLRAAYSPAWSPDGRKLATVTVSTVQPKIVKIWDTSDGRELLSSPVPGAQELAWSPDGAYLAAAGNGGTARVLDASNGRELLTLRGHRDYVGRIAWSPDGSKLATAGDDKTAKVWDAHTGRELFTLIGAVSDIAWSPDGRKLATAGLVKVWEAGTGRELLSLPGEQPAHSLAWSPDGSRLAAAGTYETAKIWEARTGRELLTLRGHHSFVNSVAWAPDGRKLATASRDQTAKVWEADTGRELLTLRGDEGEVREAAWSPDGRKLATRGDGETVQVYAIDPVLLLRLARSRITRDLTPDECRRYLNTDHCPLLPRVP